ncbi:hypothetical protein EYC80_002447 [Monilinia laxa]|uniref:Uncharacterized protein n=1 Tax=Monilinia laxa TaxID=61186 RepID=A0A5N6K3T8_MONLA|nr:hypothetical protein EYC80_002447 [Monilinia laxa]
MQELACRICMKHLYLQKKFNRLTFSFIFHFALGLQVQLEVGIYLILYTSFFFPLPPQAKNSWWSPRYGRSEKQNQLRYEGYEKGLGWMEGRMEGRKDGWIDGWMDGWMDGWASSKRHKHSVDVVLLHT